MNTSPLFLPEQFYHVYNRGISSERIFLNNENYEFFKMKCDYYLPKICILYAYVLLPNHFHLLIKILPGPAIENAEGENFSSIVSKVLSNLFNSYTKSFNAYYHRKGTLFEPSFKRKHINDFEYLRNVILYIHQNPVHHQYCQTCAEWAYTSHHQLIHEPTTQANCEILNWFGGIVAYQSQMAKINIVLNTELSFE